MGSLYSYYGGQDQVRFCPMATTEVLPFPSANPPGTGDQAWAWTNPTIPIWGSYAFNAWMYADELAPAANNPAVLYPQYRFLSQNALQVSSLTPIFADSVWLNFWALETDTPPANLYAPGYSTYAGLPRITISRHGNGAPKAARTSPASKSLPGGINLGQADGTLKIRKIALRSSDYAWHLDWQVPATPSYRAGNDA